MTDDGQETREAHRALGTLSPVHEAMSRVMAQVRSVTKGDTKQAGKGGDAAYSFRGVDRVMNAVGPALRDHGVVVVPHKVKVYDYVTVTVGKYETKMASVRVRVIYRWFGPAGDHLDTEVVAEAFDSGDKGTAKAMSVAYRTLLIQALTLPTGEPDPDEQNFHRSGADTTIEQERDLGRWRGEVSAAGTDRVKLKALWDRMVAEWDNVPWSPDREAIIKEAVARGQQAVSEPDPKPEARPESDTGYGPADSDPNVDAAAEAWDAAWLADLDVAKKARDIAKVRELIKTALTSNAKHLANHGNKLLAEWRKESK